MTEVLVIPSIPEGEISSSTRTEALAASEPIAEAAVEIAEIEAARDIELAEIHAATEGERIEAVAEAVEHNQELDECRRNIATLAETVANFSTELSLIRERLETSPETNPPEPDVSEKTLDKQEAPEPPAKRKPAFRII